MSSFFLSLSHSLLFISISSFHSFHYRTFLFTKLNEPHLQTYTNPTFSLVYILVTSLIANTHLKHTCPGHYIRHTPPSSKSRNPYHNHLYIHHHPSPEPLHMTPSPFPAVYESAPYTLPSTPCSLSAPSIHAVINSVRWLERRGEAAVVVGPMPYFPYLSAVNT